MKIYEFYRKIKSPNPKVSKAFSKLNNLYSKIPDTKGCLENLKECKVYCCRDQTPQFLYVEFLNIWKYIKKNWDNNKLCDIIEKSMMNVIKGDTTKGCVFFNNETGLCDIYKKRSYNCRIYAITPELEFKPRYEKMKELYKNIPGAIVREQCNLISTCDECKVTIFDTNHWWKELVIIEKSIGIKEELINDKEGGSYRAPHDHLLLFLMPENILSSLAAIRLYDNAEDKIKRIKEFMGHIKNFYG